MKIFDTITTGVKRYYSVAKTQLIHYSPEIRMVGGTALVIYGAYRLYKAGKQNEIDGIDKHFEQQMDDLEKNHAPKSINDQAKWYAIREYVLYKARICAVGGLCVAGGTLLEWNAFGSLKARNALLGASLAAAVASNKKMEERIIEMTSDLESDDPDYTSDAVKLDPIGNEVVEHTEVEENGHEIHVIDGDVMVVDVNKINDIPGTGFIVCKETLPLGYSLITDSTYFEDLVDQSLNVIKNRLEQIDGYAFEDNIVELFSVEPKTLHHTCGWVRGDKFEIKYRPIMVQYEDESRAPGWYVQFVGDHSIIDIYHKYSLRMVKRYSA